jgi:hypothetical protein
MRAIDMAPRWYGRSVSMFYAENRKHKDAGVYVLCEAWDPYAGFYTGEFFVSRQKHLREAMIDGRVFIVFPCNCGVLLPT